MAISNSDKAKQYINKIRDIKDLPKIFPGYITHIRFPLYKNILSGTRIDFPFPVTALVGANGTGKTSVLNALAGAPSGYSTGDYWFGTEVDPIDEGDGSSPNRFIYGHYNPDCNDIVETRKARVKRKRRGRLDPNYWEPTKETHGDEMEVPNFPPNALPAGRSNSNDRWNPVTREVAYINFRRELSAFDKFFYFGREPNLSRLQTKPDLIVRDAQILRQVIDSKDLSVTFGGPPVATENRLLNQDELAAVGRILGREYVEARIIRHRLFRGEKGQENLSVLFKTSSIMYSEAFAGSGEVAIASCVIQVLKAKQGTLLLLDEPEVSLHPGAQERLLEFLLERSIKQKLQIIFSTHAPAMIRALPEEAIKVFVQTAAGKFSVLPGSNPYAAFRRLGAREGGGIRIVVEDWLAAEVVKTALLLLDDAERQRFRVDFVPGGASTISKYRIPVLMEDGDDVFVLLDGDQRRVPEFSDPEQIPSAKEETLSEIIKKEVGVEPQFHVDGSPSQGCDVEQLNKNRRAYLKWIRGHLRYLPRTSPEEIVLAAAGQIPAGEAITSKIAKTKLRDLVVSKRGEGITADDIDYYGVYLLSEHREKNDDLKTIGGMLREFAAAVRPV